MVSDPWWSADFEGTFTVSRVELTSRNSYANLRGSSVTIEVGGQVCAAGVTSIGAGETRSIECAPGVTGSSIRIIAAGHTFMNMCGVKVFGRLPAEAPTAVAAAVTAEPAPPATVSTTLATIVSCSASSSHSSGDYDCEKAYDGKQDTEWATNNQAVGSWIRLNFAKETRVNRINYTNRYNHQSEANKVLKLTFSDGSTQRVGDLQRAGISSLRFDEVATSSVLVEVVEVYTSFNNGAQQIEFWCQDC
jgi:hypothetical protein